MSESQSLGDRLRSGLFNRNRSETVTAGSAPGAQSSAGGNSAQTQVAQQQAQIDNLNAQIMTLTSSEKQLKEQNEQLSVQKSLLQNLIDRIGEDDSEGGEMKQLTEEVQRLQKETAEQSTKLSSTTAELEATTQKLQTAELHSNAFSKAVENANAELLQSEQERRQLQSDASQAVESKALSERLQQELSSTQATVEALMSKVSKMDNEKEHFNETIAELRTELEAAKQEVTAAKVAAAEEQSAAAGAAAERAESQQLLERQASAANVAELAEVKSERDRLKAESEIWKSQIEKLKDDSEQVKSQLNQQTEVFAELKLQSKEQLSEKEDKIVLLEEELKSAMERIDDLSPALEAAQVAKETLTCDLDDAKEAAAKKETELQQALEELTAEFQSATEELEKEKIRHEETKSCGQEALEAAKRQVDDLEASHVEASEEHQRLQTELEDAIDKGEAEKRTRLMLKQECERLSDANQELESRLADVEGQANIREKKKTALVKDLQNQMVQLERDLEEAKADAARHKATADSFAAQRLGMSAGGHADPNSSSVRATNGAGAGGGGGQPSVEALQLAKDNNGLIQRVADLQEKVWMLEAAKTSYEQEMDRLSQEVDRKNGIIQAYFAEAAQKQNGKSLSSSLFGPKKEDVHAAMQSMLETTLADHMQCQAELRAKTAQLENAMEVVRSAQEQGFEVIIEEEGDGDDGTGGGGGMDDVFE